VKIIQERTQVRIEEYRRVFKMVGAMGSRFSFDCDQDGKVDESKLKPAALDNYRQCLTGRMRLSTKMYDVADAGVENYGRFYWEPAVGICACRREVPLEGFTNTCDCGRDYSQSGQQLGSRENWGAETNESLSDILSIDRYDPEDLLGD
jgi:hypothetical protein